MKRQYPLVVLKTITYGWGETCEVCEDAAGMTWNIARR
jgi:hypothetical protein